MRIPARATLAGALVVVTLAGATTSAVADRHPIPTKAQVAAARQAAAARAGDVAALRAELVLAQSRLQAAAEKAEIASEAYNGARWQLQQATAAAHAAAAAAAAAAKKVADQREGIGALVAQSYQDGSELAGFTAYLGPGGPSEVVSRIGAVESATESLQARYDDYVAADALAKVARAKADETASQQRAATKKAAASRDAAAAAATSAQAEADAIAGRRAQLIADLARAEKISVALATQRQQGLEKIAQEKAAAAAAAAAAKAAAKAKARAEAEAAAAAAAGSSGQGQSGEPAQPAHLPPVASTGAAARAIAFARAQLGDPYRWAAAGPDSWDCSGLMMKAWGSAGVSLPHYSAAQYSETTPVSVTDLRPGDLVFWGDSPSTIHHVAMYLGNGQIIHAPRTGRPVSIDSMYYWVPPNYFGRP